MFPRIVSYNPTCGVCVHSPCLGEEGDMVVVEGKGVGRMVQLEKMAVVDFAKNLCKD